ncbi:MAG: polyprenol monophosphomannose synthase [Negativicutes bacterium]
MKLVIIPTYNERENLEKLVAAIYQTIDSIHILIVDDNSPDGTGEFVKGLIEAQYCGRLFLIQRAGKLGLGTAYVTGFKWALAREYQYIFQMDADFSHNPRYLRIFVETMEDCDLVLGSRYIAGGGVENWGLVRRIVSRCGSLYSRNILELPFRDLTGGFKCFRREVLEQLDLEDIKSNGYSFQIEMTYRTFLNNFRIKEIPIIFAERVAGKSKMSRNIFIEAIVMVWKLRAAKFEIESKGTGEGAPSTLPLNS